MLGLVSGLWIACVAWRFWLLSNKGGRGQKNREEIGAGATGFSFSRGFAARSRALRARISRLRRSCARLDKTAMLRRLGFGLCYPRQRLTCAAKVIFCIDNSRYQR